MNRGKYDIYKNPPKKRVIPTKRSAWRELRIFRVLCKYSVR